MDIRNTKGTTLIELLVAMTIIGIMTAIFVSQISLSNEEQLDMVTERLVADFKQIRNLATSRVINENNVYPPGGYGIYFDDSHTAGNSYYILFADDGVTPGYDEGVDIIISKYILPDSNLTFYPIDHQEIDKFYFTFVNEHEAVTDVEPKEPDGYSILIQFKDTAPINTIRISDPAVDDYVWGNINVLYGV